MVRESSRVKPKTHELGRSKLQFHKQISHKRQPCHFNFDPLFFVTAFWNTCVDVAWCGYFSFTFHHWRWCNKKYSESPWVAHGCRFSPRGRWNREICVFFCRIFFCRRHPLLGVWKTKKNLVFYGFLTFGLNDWAIFRWNLPWTFFRGVTDSLTWKNGKCLRIDETLEAKYGQAAIAALAIETSKGHVPQTYPAYTACPRLRCLLWKHQPNHSWQSNGPGILEKNKPLFAVAVVPVLPCFCGGGKGGKDKTMKLLRLWWIDQLISIFSIW